MLLCFLYFVLCLNIQTLVTVTLDPRFASYKTPISRRVPEQIAIVIRLNLYSISDAICFRIADSSTNVITSAGVTVYVFYNTEQSIF